MSLFTLVLDHNYRQPGAYFLSLVPRIKGNIWFILCFTSIKLMDSKEKYKKKCQYWAVEAEISWLLVPIWVKILHLHHQGGLFIRWLFSHAHAHEWCKQLNWFCCGKLVELITLLLKSICVLNGGFAKFEICQCEENPLVENVSLENDCLLKPSAEVAIPL